MERGTYAGPVSSQSSEASAPSEVPTISVSPDAKPIQDATSLADNAMRVPRQLSLVPSITALPSDWDQGHSDSNPRRSVSPGGEVLISHTFLVSGRPIMLSAEPPVFVPLISETFTGISKDIVEVNVESALTSTAFPLIPSTWEFAGPPPPSTTQLETETLESKDPDLNFNRRGLTQDLLFPSVETRTYTISVLPATTVIASVFITRTRHAHDPEATEDVESDEASHESTRTRTSEDSESERTKDDSTSEQTRDNPTSKPTDQPTVSITSIISSAAFPTLSDPPTLSSPSPPPPLSSGAKAGIAVGAIFGILFLLLLTLVVPRLILKRNGEKKSSKSRAVLQFEPQPESQIPTSRFSDSSTPPPMRRTFTKKSMRKMSGGPKRLISSPFRRTQSSEALPHPDRLSLVETGCYELSDTSPQMRPSTTAQSETSPWMAQDNSSSIYSAILEAYQSDDLERSNEGGSQKRTGVI
ncbi:Fc.00g043820.m01.CDS01 [Cosmosporella sp. VM-42]